MEKNVADLAKHVLKKPLHECDPDEIRQLIKEFPYFSPAYFLLLKKLDPGSEEYRSVYQTGILYYNDPLAFDRVINDERYRQETFIPIHEENTVVNKKEEEQSFEENNNHAYHPTGVIEELDGSNPDVFINPDLPANTDVETPVESEFNNSFETDSREEVNIESLEAKDYNRTDLDQGILQQDIEHDASERTDEATQDDVHDQPEIINAPDQDIAEPVNEFKGKEKETAEDEIPVKFNIDLKAPAEGDLSFEPYHTVDYFASQGIKISQVDTGKDKFGKQLKSFTEWLKTMKRLPQAEIAAKVDENSESKVENLAAGSLQDREVVTEAMAEVWLKQGNKAKALEVYNKLSLLNPSKKAYFAAKIEQFNSHN